MQRQEWVIVGVIAVMIALTAAVSRPEAKTGPGDYLRATYSPLHFKPAILAASDADCLACHREVLDDKPREVSPAGVKAAETRAWYQQVATYEGSQESFHRRHLVTPFAKTVMNLKCNTCHEGHDPREEAQGSSATTPSQDDRGFTLRKQVNPETTCLKCHGQMNWKVMGLPGPWEEFREAMGNNCLNCHATIRTERHRVTYLNADVIEAAGAKNSEVCHGCHGGRAWYRIPYPYPRHAWSGMDPALPAWAASRPTESEERFRIPSTVRTFKP